MTRTRVPISSAWAETIGYSRAIRAGDLIFVSGTTATGPDGKALHPGDAAAQARVILERILAALGELGTSAEHVVETRVFLTDISTWQDVGRTHGEVFRDIRPAVTIVEVGPFIAPGLLGDLSCCIAR